MAVEIKIKPRDKKTPRALRREGIIPATLYGPEIEATNIQLDAHDFSKVPFEDYTHLIHLQEEGKDDHEVLIKNIQRDYVSLDVLNIEFYQVMRGHKVTMNVTLKFTGTSEAVKMGADLVTVHKEAHIRCLPRNIPYFIEVDISKLEKDGDHITFADLNINREEIEILDPEKEIICKAQTKRKDHTIVEETPAAEGEEAAAAEGAAPAEGAAGAEAAKAEEKK